MRGDDAYVDLGFGGCTLDGLERARLRMDLQVRVQGVTPVHAGGHITSTLAFCRDISRGGIDTKQIVMYRK